MELEHTLLAASAVDQAKTLGLVKKAGETPQYKPLPASMEEVFLRGLLGLDESEPITQAHMESAARMYGIELQKPE